MGGVLVFGALDAKQTMNISGIPFLMSPHIITCFKLSKLQHTVRSSKDKLQQEFILLSRKSASHFRSHPENLDRFIKLLSDNCTFVKNWNANIIDRNTLCVFLKREPCEIAKENFIKKCKTN